MMEGKERKKKERKKKVRLKEGRKKVKRKKKETMFLKYAAGEGSKGLVCFPSSSLSSLHPLSLSLSLSVARFFGISHK